MWRCAPTPRRSRAGSARANSRPIRAMSAAGTPHSSAQRSHRILLQPFEQGVVASGVRAAPRPRPGGPRPRPRASSRAPARRRCPGAGADARRPPAPCGCGRDRSPRSWRRPCAPPAAAARGEERSTSGSSPTAPRTAPAASSPGRPRGRCRAWRPRRSSRPSRRSCAPARWRRGRSSPARSSGRTAAVPACPCSCRAGSTHRHARRSRACRPAATRSSASSHEARRNSPAPLGPVRMSGCSSRSSAYTRSR